MAGVDKEFNGEASLSAGYTVGYLEQEPLLDSEKTVKAVVEEGLQEIVDIVKEYNEISEKSAEPMSDDEMNRLLKRQGKLPEEIEKQNGRKPCSRNWSGFTCRPKAAMQRQRHALVLTNHS